jgi:hypothetical protein
MVSSGRRWLRTTVSLLPTVLGSIVLAVAGLAAVRECIPVAVLRPCTNEIGSFIQALSTIYAVLLAFVVYVVWAQFNETRTLLDREANELLDLYRTARGFMPETREAIQQELHAYVCDVIGREWAALARGDDAVIDDVGRRLDRVWSHVTRLEPATDCHVSLFDEVLTRFNDLSDCRTNRISSSRMRIPLALRLLLYFGAVITVGSLYLLAFDSFTLHAIAAGALAGAVSHILYIVSDLDNPFSGDWQVEPRAFLRVRRYMEM